MKTGIVVEEETPKEGSQTVEKKEDVWSARCRRTAKGGTRSKAKLCRGKFLNNMVVQWLASG